MREIVLDTETTGLDPAQGHRIVEIGCVEVLNGIPTGATHHVYLDPERDMPADAFAVHGLSSAFLTGKPRFADKAEEFLAFVGDARLEVVGLLVLVDVECGYLSRDLFAASLQTLDFVLCCFALGGDLVAE